MKTHETERLILRNFLQQDAEDLLKYWQHPSVNCFAPCKLENISAANNYIDKKSLSDDNIAVCLKSTGQLIGDVFCMKDSIGTDTYNVAWSFNPDYQGKGYAAEAAKAFFLYLYEERNARRLCAHVEDYNVPSQRLCERLGMRKEAFFKEYVTFVNDEDGNPIYENTFLYALLKKEWQ
jgi:[ribosomal protein S5]-alanine N-acetyltransferase